MKTAAKLALTLGFLLLPACKGAEPPAAQDLAVVEDPDLRRPPGDLAKPPPTDLPARCELPAGGDVRPIAQVADGKVDLGPPSGDPPVYTAKVDAIAGGSMNYQSRPYVYLDLIGAKKVDITDVQARESKDWDIAFKRWQIKLNSGDSGDGGVTLAVVKDKTFEEVKAAPAGPYVEDDYLDPECMVLRDPIGGLLTAMSDWYEYNLVSMRLDPRKEVYVLKRRDGKGAIKLQILGYYDDMMRGGVYQLRWSALP